MQWKVVLLALLGPLVIIAAVRFAIWLDVSNDRDTWW